MSLEIRRIAPLRAANVVAVFYFITFLVFSVVMFVTMGFQTPPANLDEAQRANYQQTMRWFMLAYPFLGAIFGWIFTALSAGLYNFLAPRLGGLLFEVDQSGPSPLGTRSAA